MPLLASPPTSYCHNKIKRSVFTGEDTNIAMYISFKILNLKYYLLNNNAALQILNLK
jgi:hypothetical protein